MASAGSCGLELATAPQCWCSIREWLDLSDGPERSCAEADRIARAHLREVEVRIASLTALRAELKRMITRCGRDRIADCRVIGVLADHAHCLTPDHGRPAAPHDV